MESGGIEARAVILAGGRSKRMKSAVNKVLHPICGREVVAYVREACTEAGIETVYLVTGIDEDEFRRRFGNQYRYIRQSEPLGTGHAVMQAAEALTGFSGALIVLAGDSPLIDGKTLWDLREHQCRTAAAAVLLTAEFDEMLPFGRIIRDDAGNFLRIVEAKDATAEELKIREVNVTVYCFYTPALLPLLSELRNDNAQREYYITDIFEIMREKGLPVETLRSGNPHIGFGINTPEDFDKTQRILQREIVNKFLEGGVHVPEPGSVRIDSTVHIGAGTFIDRDCVITGKSVIGRDCRIGPGATIHDSRVGNKSVITGQKIMGSVLPDGTIFIKN